MGMRQHGSNVSLLLLLESVTFLISISHCFSSATGPTMRFVLFLLSDEGRLTIRASAEIVFPRPIYHCISKSGAHCAEEISFGSNVKPDGGDLREE